MHEGMGAAPGGDHLLGGLLLQGGQLLAQFAQAVLGALAPLRSTIAERRRIEPAQRTASRHVQARIRSLRREWIRGAAAPPIQPRPTKGICVAITVMLSTLADKGRLAM
jgi:hypothetical protein